jgi:E3 ubiquitin-protein ligase MARCH6
MACNSTLDHGLDLEDVLHYGGLDVRALSLMLLLRSLSATASAWWISDRPREGPSPGLGYFPFYLNDTRDNQTSGDVTNSTIFGLVTSHPVWKAVSADIFAGQIIVSLIVLTFVAVFLLREWIVQNARPGVFEDMEMPVVEGDEVPPPVEPVEAPRAADDAELAPEDSSDSGSETHVSSHDADFPTESSSDEAMDMDSTGFESRELRRPEFGILLDREPSLQERRRVMRNAAMHRRRIENEENSVGSSSGSSPPPPGPRPRFHTRYERRSSSEPRTIGSSPSFLDASDDDMRRLRPLIAPADTSSSIPRSPSSIPRRPPLPTSGRSSRTHTPLASPGLATYRAPEDLAAGPSGIGGYFDEEAGPIPDFEREHRRYFKEPDGSEDHMSDSERESVGLEDFEDFSDSLPSLESLESDSLDDEDELDDVLDEDEELNMDRQPVDVRLDGAIRDDLPAEENAPPLEGNEDFDPLVDDDNDMDGALEGNYSIYQMMSCITQYTLVIGLRGPIFGIFQNVS